MILSLATFIACRWMLVRCESDSQACTQVCSWVYFSPTSIACAPM
uniref:Uncharacterized protein n=1 Tax=Rhizophora mucronata TaxID=61149 RepID=A0A2P2N2R7_RHIMU